MNFVAAIMAQFKKSRGLFGRLIGLIMANRPSNRARNAWTVQLLRIGAGDRVLELGCGPGLALADAAARAVIGSLFPFTVGAQSVEADLVQQGLGWKSKFARAKGMTRSQRSQCAPIDPPSLGGLAGHN